MTIRTILGTVGFTVLLIACSQPKAIRESSAKRDSTLQSGSGPDAGADDLDDIYPQTVARFEAEGRSGWGREATETFSRDFSRHVQQRGGTVVDAECRSTLCRGTVRWKTREAASKARSLAGAGYEPNCITMLAQESPENPLSTVLLLDCDPGHIARGSFTD